jgi:hypothetical protein
MDRALLDIDDDGVNLGGIGNLDVKVNPRWIGQQVAIGIRCLDCHRIERNIGNPALLHHRQGVGIACSTDPHFSAMADTIERECPIAAGNRCGIAKLNDRAMHGRAGRIQDEPACLAHFQQHIHGWETADWLLQGTVLTGIDNQPGMMRDISEAIRTCRICHIQIEDRTVLVDQRNVHIGERLTGLGIANDSADSCR